MNTAQPTLSPWLFDAQDHALVDMVNHFAGARTADPPPLNAKLHPHGIVELASGHGLRMARSLIILLDSLNGQAMEERGQGMEERLQALERLRNEVLNTARAPLRKNTGRVLIQLMKELVRASPHTLRQLPLAHQFHRAASGNPRIIRALLARYHLLEMPEAWNQQAFDHHVHDANTKGRKNPTHLIMDAWVKGLRFLTVVYYNSVEDEAATELLRASRIMNITVRIGIEFRATLKKHDNTTGQKGHREQAEQKNQGGQLVDLMWSPLHCDDATRFLALMHRPEIQAVLDLYKPVQEWMRAHVLELLRAWNEKHSIAFASSWDLQDAETGQALPAPVSLKLNATDFLAHVGHRQPSSLHLAEYICSLVLPLLRQRAEQWRQDLPHEEDKQKALLLRQKIGEAENLVPDTLREVWLGPAANADILFPTAPHPLLPDIWQSPPEALLARLVPLHPCQMVLNLADLSAADVLTLLWRAEGRITHVELFNLREWNRGRLSHARHINALQRALNEGSAIDLKQIIRRIALSVEQEEEKQATEASKKNEEETKDAGGTKDQALFQEILDHIPRLQACYALAPLGSRLGTDSTSHSHHTHGMGFVFTETLPPEARRALRTRPPRQPQQEGQRLTLPVHTRIYSYVQFHDDTRKVGFFLRLLRSIPGCTHAGRRKVRGWSLEKGVTHITDPGSKEGNIITLGGVDAAGRNNDLESSAATHAAVRWWDLRHWNSTLVNVLKVLAGFLPAQWAFGYTSNWWVLTFFGPLIWFGITGFRNVVQSVLGGGGLTRSVLLPWKRYISWSRLADSLFFTGFSVPLLDVVVRLWLLQDSLGYTVHNAPLVVYASMALINSLYISGHNLFRGLPREAVIGNFFRSALSVPLSLLLGEGLLHFFTWLALPSPLDLVQNCAAITSKCASDTVAAVIEGFADARAYRKRRAFDYEEKLLALYANYSRQELLFPRQDLTPLLKDPAHYLALLKGKDAPTAEEAIIHLLDLMYFWYYQPQARSVFHKEFCEATTEERRVFTAMLGLLSLEKEVCETLLQGMLGRDFGPALAFYLQKHKDFVKDMDMLTRKA